MVGIVIIKSTQSIHTLTLYVCIYVCKCIVYIYVYICNIHTSLYMLAAN